MGEMGFVAPVKIMGEVNENYGTTKAEQLKKLQNQREVLSQLVAVYEDLSINHSRALKMIIEARKDYLYKKNIAQMNSVKSSDNFL